MDIVTVEMNGDVDQAESYVLIMRFKQAHISMGTLQQSGRHCNSPTSNDKEYMGYYLQ